MAVVPLTTAQQRSVDTMVASGELRPVVPDEVMSRAFLAGAEAALADVPNVTRVENKDDLAYKAAHDTGQGMLEWAADAWSTRGQVSRLTTRR